jgi:hypothetical protein
LPLCTQKKKFEAFYNLAPTLLLENVRRGKKMNGAPVAPSDGWSKQDFRSLGSMQEGCRNGFVRLEDPFMGVEGPPGVQQQIL